MMGATTIKMTGRKTAARERLTAKRLAVMLAVLSLALVALLVVAVAIGSESVRFATILKIISAEITGRAASGVTPEQHIIIAQIRLPRALMAMVVGAALAVAGAAYQALLRNPLADPGILGVSSGAAVGAIAATIFADALPVGRPIAAFIGAGLTIAFVYALGQGRQGDASTRLILAGVITSALLSSIVIFLVTTAGTRQRSVISWLIGDMGGETSLLPLIALFVLAGVAVIYVNARSLNLLMVGEADALALGVEVGRVKLVVYVAASLLTGAAVAVSGAIGFVGLIIPHAVRLVGGGDNRLVIPASALAGSAFLLLADTVARTVIAPLELNIGVITALVGAPVFIYLLRRTS